MKTLLSIILSLSFILSACGTQSTQSQPEASKPTNHFTYEITSTNDQDITGKALNNVSSTNQGIYLTPSDLPFNVSTGDIITVTYGEYSDDIQSIEKAIQAEDGSFVPESFYK